MKTNYIERHGIHMHPANPEKLATAAPELLLLLTEAKYTIADMEMLIPEGKGDSEYYGDFFRRIVATLNSVYDK